ncbi:MAG TPA: hypothetical protein VNK04_04340 [Gemmataceae bacterium]|nr:hypothetical protein [Gemmataceae bacterium]
MPRPAGPTPAAPTKQTAVPPLPAPTSSTSPAALAGGVFQPLDPRPEFRTTGRGAGPSWKGPGTAGAVLQPPEPVAEGLPRSDPGPAPGFTLVGGPRPLTYEQAQTLLQARGVTWQRLEAGPEPGEWKFSCSIPNRQNPQIRRFYEAKAQDPITAIRAVLEQMDRERE